MFRKEIKRKWLVNFGKINIENTKYDKITIGLLSQKYDSLNVSVININNKYFELSLSDSGGNNMVFNISKNEYEQAIQLAGNKIISKKRYYIQSDDLIINVDVFDKYDFVIAEICSDNQIVLDTFIEKEWFMKEISDDEKFNINNLIYD